MLLHIDIKLLSLLISTSWLRALVLGTLPLIVLILGWPRNLLRHPSRCITLPLGVLHCITRLKFPVGNILLNSKK